MKKSMLWVLGITAYLLFTLLLTPASLWLKLVTLPTQVQLGAVTGTVWAGQVAGVQAGPFYLPQLSWQLQPALLWRGKLGLKLQGGNLRDATFPYLSLQAELGLGQLALTNSNLRVPVAPVMSQLQLPMPVDASGAIVLNLQDFALGQPYCTALAGTASWQQAKFKAPTGWIDLQAIDGTLSCDNGNISLQTKADNPLGLLVKADILQGSYQIAGTLKPAASMPKEVHQAMQFVGQADAEGRFPLRLQGRIGQ